MSLNTSAKPLLSNAPATALPFTSSLLPFNTAQSLSLSFALAVITPVFQPGSPLRRGILALQILVLIHGYFAAAPAGVDNSSVIYTNGVLLANLTLRYLDRLYLRNPEQSFYRVYPDKTGKLVQEHVSSLSPWRKLLWSFELLATTRGIGWNWQVVSIPTSKERVGKISFALGRLRTWVLMYTGVYLVSVGTRALLDGFSQVRDEQLRNMLVTVTARKEFLCAVVILGWALTIYTHFAMMMLPLSAICVGLGVGPQSWREPEDWPDNFGPLTEAYSIRRFWGYFWHQQIRRIAATPGAWLLSKLPKSIRESQRLPVRLARRYGLVFGSFLTSGLFHASGTFMVTRLYGLPLSDGGELKYFSLQGLAMMIEDFACWILRVDDRSRNPTWTRMILGYVITATWYTWSRVTFKSIPIALAHGIQDERGDLFAAVELVRRGADAIPGNFVAAGVHLLQGKA